MSIKWQSGGKEMQKQGKMAELIHFMYFTLWNNVPGFFLLGFYLCWLDGMHKFGVNIIVVSMLLSQYFAVYSLGQTDGCLSSSLSLF